MPLLSHTLEERVTENAVRFHRSVEISNTRVERRGIAEAGRDRGVADAFDHGGEGLPGDAVDEVGPARIDVHQGWKDVTGIQAGCDHEWIELPADEGVAARPPLQLDLTPDGQVGRAAVGVEAGRSVVTLDDGQGAAGPQQLMEDRQRLDGSRQVLEDEADEDVVEGPGGEGQ